MFAIFILGYFAAYAHFRQRGEIIHFKRWRGNDAIHLVNAVELDAKMVFVGAMMKARDKSGHFSTNQFEADLDTGLKFIEKRRWRLNVSFAPWRWLEEIAWEVVDPFSPSG